MPFYFGLRSKPKQPDETFELLSGVFGSEVFSKGEALGVLIDNLEMSAEEANRRFQNLVNLKCIQPC